MNGERNLPPVYSEVQNYSRWWLVLAAIPPIVPLFFILNDHSGKDLFLPILIVIIVSTIIPFLFLGSLKVELRPDTISFKLPPFLLHWFSVGKGDIAKIYIR